MTITIDFWLFLEEILVFFSDVYSTQVAFNIVLNQWLKDEPGPYPSRKNNQDGMRNYVHSRFN